MYLESKKIEGPNLWKREEEELASRRQYGGAACS